MSRLIAPLFFLLILFGMLPQAHAESFQEAPRILAALAQGQAAENGPGKNLVQAIRLYCDAATMGSPEGFFRVGRVLATAPGDLRNPQLANSYLALAARLGNAAAMRYYDASKGSGEVDGECMPSLGDGEEGLFNMEAYLNRQPLERQKIARLIRKEAPKFNIDVRFALAVALAESNLDPAAVSPQNAQGVMQLMPATQARFGVRKAFDPEQNIKGAMAYLRWLGKRFEGDWRLVAAAYNAGEGAVDRHSGVPPYAETRQYVRRVMYFSGMSTTKPNRRM